MSPGELRSREAVMETEDQTIQDCVKRCGKFVPKTDIISYYFITDLLISD